MKKRNIGIVTPWFERGAANVSIQYIKMLEQEFNVYIYGRTISSSLSDQLKQYKLTPALRLPYRTRDKTSFNHLNKWINKHSIEIILFNEQHSWDIIANIRQKRNDIIIGAYVDYYTEETVPFFEAYDFLLCNTKRHFSVFHNHPQSFYIPWGTDLSVFKDIDISVKGNSAPIFFHSAGFNPIRKGTFNLIKAFYEIKNPHIKLIIHSQIPLEKYTSISHMLKTDKRIEIIHKTVPPPGLYYKGDVYVYPTELEGIGLTIIEALASGLPVITTNNPPMNEFITNDIGKLIEVEKLIARADGYYWPKAIININNLQEQMQYYIDNFNTLHKIKQTVYQYAHKHFNWAENAKELPFIFKSLKKTNISENLLKQIYAFEKQKSGCGIKLFHTILSCSPIPEKIKHFIYNNILEYRWKKRIR